MDTLACLEQLTVVFGFFHQSSTGMTVQPEVVTVVTGGIVATQGRVLAVAMMALENRHISGLDMQKMISST